MLPKQIPKKFNKNNMELFVMRVQSNFDKPSPITERGGIIDAEIAIPTIFSERVGFTYAYVPTMPLKIATTKYNMFGSVLAIISTVVINSLLLVIIMRWPVNAEVSIASRPPLKIDKSVRKIPFSLNKIMFNEKPKKGEMSGATTMPPMIIGALFNMSPIEMIDEARAVKTKNSIVGLLYCLRCFCAFDRMRAAEENILSIGKNICALAKNRTWSSGSGIPCFIHIH